MRLIVPLLSLQIVYAFTSDYFYGICKSIIVTNPAMGMCTDGETSCGLLTDGQNCCLCENNEYLRSMFKCVTSAGDIAGIHNAAEQSWNALTIATLNYTGHAPEHDYCRMKEIIEKDPVHLSYDEAAKIGYGAFYTPKRLLSPKVIQAGCAYSKNIYASNVYGMATVGYVAVIMLIQSFLNLCGNYAPGIYHKFLNSRPCRFFRKHISMPALFHQKRAVPVQIPCKVFKWDLSFPPRLHSILIVGYFIVNMTLLFIQYDFVTTQFSYPTKIEAVTKLIGYRSGYFAIYKLVLIILFASKNNILLWSTGWGYDVFNHWHRAISRLFLLDIILHAVCYSTWGQWAGVYINKWQSFPPWIAAQTATIAAGLMCLLGNKTIRSKFYDTFRATHVIFALIVMVGIYVHISYFQLAMYPFYVALAFWIFERAARILRVFWTGIYTRGNITEEADGILKINIDHPGRWKPKGGSYVFVHFLRGFECLNPHPFTVVRGKKENSAQLYIKAREGRTKQILQRVRKENGSLNMPLWVEGPYGHDFEKKSFSEIVFIAGGVGITGVFSQLDSACRRSSTQNFYVYWSIPHTSWLETFRELVELMAKEPRVMLIVYVTREPVEAKEKQKIPLEQAIVFSRPDLAQITHLHIEGSIGPTCFFVCGPAVMCDQLRNRVKTNMCLTRNYVEYNEECFSM